MQISLLSHLAFRSLTLVILTVFIVSYLVWEQNRKEANDALQLDHEEFLETFESHIESRISSLIWQIEGIARNGLVINGLIDLQNRDSYVPIYFESVSLPYLDAFKIVYTDYRGRRISANTDDASVVMASSTWVQKTLENEQTHFELTSEGLFVSVPVFYAGSAEGAVVVLIEPGQFQSLFKYGAFEINGAVIGANNRILYSSSTESIFPLGEYQGLNPDKWYSRIKTSSSFPAIVNSLVSFQSNDTAFLNLKKQEKDLMLAIVVAFIGLSVSVIVSARTASRLVKQLGRAIQQVKGSKRLSSRVRAEGPKEMVEVGELFNDMMKQLEATTFSKERVNAIIDSMQEMLLVIGTDGELIQMNASCEKFMRSVGKDARQDYKQILSDPSLGASFDQNLLLENFTVRISPAHDVQASPYIIVWTRVPLKSDDNVVGYIYTGADVTTQHKTESSLRVLTRAVEVATNGITIADARQDDIPLIYANKAFLDMSGYQIQEVLGLNCRFLQGKGTDANEIQKLADAIKRQETCTAVIRNYRKDGTAFWCELSLTPLVDEQGQLTHYLGVQNDVTERIENEAELEIAKQKAELASQAKGDFLSTMSHEIRTPMNGVLGMAELLAKTDLNAKQQDFVRTILDSGQSLVNIINDILDFSKIESGKLELETIEFSMEPIAHDVMYLFSNQAQKKDLELVLDVDPFIPHCILGDSGRIRQILLNLVGNAVKFTNDGFVLLTVAEKEDEAGAHLVFSVQDSGVGIPEEKLANLFTPFTQADSSTTRTYGGSGLGLSICRSLVEAMGGRIGCESVLGEGSTFYFEIPLQISPMHVEVGHEYVDLSGKKIALLNCDQESAPILVNRLSSWHACVNNLVQDLPVDDVISQMDDVDCLIVNLHQYDDWFSQLMTSIAQKLPALSVVGLVNPFDRAHQSTMLSDARFHTVDKPFSNPALSNVLSRAIFNIELASDTEREVGPQIGNSALNHFSGKRVLLVDDNSVNRKVAQSLLEMMNIEVDQAENGVEAIRAWENDNYDLILMDCLMPEMDGYEATGHIRSMERKNQVEEPAKIIALTANAMESARQKCLDAGMDDFLTKPIDPATLSEVLSRWFGGEESVEIEGHASHLQSGHDQETDQVNEEADETEPVFDPSAFQLLGPNLMHMFPAMVEAGLTDMNEQIGHLRSVSSGPDKDIMVRAAHSMKSCSAQLGGKALSKFAKDKEAQYIAGDLSSLEEDIVAFENYKVQLEEKLKVVLEELRNNEEK